MVKLMQVDMFDVLHGIILYAWSIYVGSKSDCLITRKKKLLFIVEKYAKNIL